MFKKISGLKIGLLGLAFVSLSACSWVKPIEGANRVDIKYAYDVTNCQKIGSTTSTARDKVGFFERDINAIRGDLTKLAQNEAARMGGDTIVATTPPIDGRMSFDVYRCNTAQQQ
ncbi:DUF4156 domain-containing protein [Thiomicrorhabdus aquaedulcis]|uniref:DUF4156 domain-containing protein n=1 Tax=Thiomicrorhabdus aquaedulcis TaxID=2211106 RepID=UPI000FDC6DD6|nr:DUF4156 domain-containing protein [Thiomicrorhabdus aquaedulcis]